MIWLGIFAFAAIMAAASTGANRLWLVYIALALLAVQGLKHPVMADMRTALFCAVWISVSTAILLAPSDVNPRLHVTISCLTLLSAICYPVGAALGQPPYLEGSRFASHLFWADMAMIAAISAGGWHGLVDRVKSGVVALAGLARGAG